ncbi:membrane protein insertase YidC [Vulgatibacter incomptus]|uniref:Membrane protein insertase YidC n=1 Tax=Vulgatibacter incomptus TaxID=1391653 RepID=A0A0K1PH52_9BACT|nr:membrane protein insertase YidC [Vulgatibacter incomptus]AKU92850.1 Inner membrane protein translocase component YidC, long form [Vulgatibacter incomptus]
MDSNKRLILTVGISLAIFLGYQWTMTTFFPAPAPHPTASTEIKEAPGSGDVVPALHERSADEAGNEGDAVPAGDEGTVVAAALPQREVTLRTDDLLLGFSSHGAGLFKAELLGRKGQRQGGTDAPQVDLAGALQPSDPLLFEATTGEGLPVLGNRAPCSVAGSDERSVTFLCDAPGLQLEKKFTVTGARTLDLQMVLHNRGAVPLAGTLGLLMPARVDPARQVSSRGCAGFGGAPPQPTQNICRADDKISRSLYHADKPSVTPEGRAWFAGIEERYFLAVAVPDQASACELVAETPEFLTTHLNTKVATIAPGASQTVRYQLVIGPKDIGLLQDASASIASSTGLPNPKLDETVDLGFWAVIARILLWLLRAAHHVIANWGVAIILLTVAVKLLTLPLAWKSMKSMEEMRKLAPEIAKLKEKFGSDREKLNLETMKLYQQHKVNPLGGCLPMLIQMPIWLALYATLQTSVELYNEPFIAGWISDLTSKDPYYALPLAMGVTMYITQKMQPMQMEAAQQKVMLYFMPIFFTFIMLQLPAGLTLYIFTNNLLSIGQQMALRKSMGIPAIGAPPPAASSATIEVAPAKKPGKKK